MERDSVRGAIQPGLKILARFAGFSTRPNGPKAHVIIETEFQPGLPKSRKQYGWHWEAEAISVELRR